MNPPLRRYLSDYAFLFAVSGLLIAADQATKALIRARLEYGQFWTPIPSLVNWVRLVNWRNTGAAFGMFQSGGVIFTVLAIVVALGIVNYFPLTSRRDGFLRPALALQLAGAVGNLVDRLTQGFVTDFISIANFPVFNVADASISIGVALILIPYLPQIGRELDGGRLARKAALLNGGRAKRAGVSKKADPEKYPLGAIELLAGNLPAVERYALEYRLGQIRRRQQERVAGISRGG